MQLPGVQTRSFNKTSLMGVLLLAGGLGLLLWLNIMVILPRTALETPDYGNDMGYFWTASRTVWQGGNPYLSNPGSLYHSVRLAAGGNPIMVDPYKSPYYLTLLFMPLALLPLNVAAVVWLTLSEILMIVTTGFILKLGRPKLTLPLVLAASGMVLLWRYTLLTLLVGQLSLLLLFAIVGAYYYSRTNRPYLGGALAGLLLIKPQIVFLVIPLLLFGSIGPSDPPRWWWNVAVRQRLTGFAVIGAIFAGYSWLLSPGWLADWLRTVFGTPDSYFDNREVDSQLSSLRSLAALISPDQKLVLPLMLLISLPFWFGLGWLWWRNRNRSTAFPYLLALAITINLMTTPYVRDYDSSLLFFGLLWSYLNWPRQENGKSQFSRLIWLLVLIPFATHLVGLKYGGAVYELIVPLLLIGLILFVWQRDGQKLESSAAL